MFDLLSELIKLRSSLEEELNKLEKDAKKSLEEYQKATAPSVDKSHEAYSKFIIARRRVEKLLKQVNKTIKLYQEPLED